MAAARSSATSERRFVPRLVLGALGLAAAGALVLHVGAGSPDGTGGVHLRLSPSEVLTELFRGDTDSGVANAIVWRIRFPRALACLLVGGILGAVGSAFQALFRNPLADPFIVGVSSGAAAGGALAIWLGFGSAIAGIGLLGTAFAGGMLSLGIVFAIAGRASIADVQRLLLCGVVVGSLLNAAMTLILLAAGEDTNRILRWMLGSMTPMYWNRVGLLGGALVLGGTLLFLQTKRLNAIAANEETARRLGVDTKRLKPAVLLVGTAMAAVTVGSVGIVGFLGLVAPHISRRVVGVDWRLSLLGSALVGMSLLTLADVLAQWILPGAELPVGIVTALIGAPFLLLLMRRSP